MAWDIWIENNFADAPVDLSAQLTYNIDDIRQFGFRNTNYSKTIILPGTGKNKKIFGHVFEAGSSNIVNDANPNVGYDFNAAKSARCLIFLDNIQLFKGVLQLTEIIEENGTVEFEVLVLGELGGLLSAMTDKKLEDLDFSAYDHTFNLVNIKNSWSSAIGSGYYYPLIDYGYSVDKVHFPIETFRPAFHVKEYIDKIFAAGKYTYTSSFFNTNYFKKQILPFNGENHTREITALYHSLRTTSYIIFGGGTALAPMPQVIVGTTLLSYDTMNYRLNWPRGEGFRAKFTISLNWTKLSSGAKTYAVGLVKQDGTVEYFFNGKVTGTSGTITGEFVADIDEYETFYFASNFGGNGGETFTASNIDINIVGNPAILIPIGVGDTVVVNNSIPKNILQLDFLKWLIKMYNLYITEDKEQVNHLNIEPYIDYFQIDPATIENWDVKVDRSKATSYRPMGELNSRSYEYKYADDSDYWNDLYKQRYGEGYGSLIYDTGFEFAKDRDTIEVGFASTPLVQFANSDRVISAIYKKSDANVYSRVSHKPRILFRSETPVPCQAWFIDYFFNPLLTDTIIDGYPYAGHLDDIDAPLNDLNWGSPRELFFTLVTGYLSANLFNVFWSFYISEISDKDSKLLTTYIKLSPADIYNLDFSRVKYINRQLWRLNKVIDYGTDKPVSVKCELLKVIDLI